MEATPMPEVSSSPSNHEDRLLTPGEVATLFRVNPKTVTRWARSGKLHAIRTLGGHRRFRASEVAESLRRMAEAS
jgi:excisionase family DNA binding protein